VVATIARLLAARHAELREDLCDVVLGAVLADAESGADLLVGQAFADEGEDFLLSGVSGHPGTVGGLVSH